jgi:hypothetical protein
MPDEIYSLNCCAITIYDSKDTGFLAMPAATLLSTSRSCRINGIDSVLGKKRLALDWMKSKVSPPLYGMGF